MVLAHGHQAGETPTTTACRDDYLTGGLFCLYN